MALIKCEECGKEVSENAKTCPNCGNPINGKRKKRQKNNKVLIISILILVIISVCVILFFFGGNKFIANNTSNTLPEEISNGINAIKLISSNNSNNTDIDITSMAYSRELKMMYISCKIVDSTKIYVFDINKNELLSDVNVFDSNSQYSGILNMENYLMKSEITFLEDYLKNKVNESNYEKLVVDCIVEGLNGLDNVSNDVNKIFEEHYRVRASLQNKLNSYFSSSASKIYGNYSNSLGNLKHIEQLVKNVSNNKEIVELYSAYKDYADNVLVYPSNYSYATYLTSMKAKSDVCHNLLTPLQLKYGN